MYTTIQEEIEKRMLEIESSKETRTNCALAAKLLIPADIFQLEITSFQIKLSLEKLKQYSNELSPFY